MLTEDQKERIRAERELIVADLKRPGVQLIFQKLEEAADAMLYHYDRQDFIKEPAKAVYIQCFRDIVKKEIPRIFENIINVDVEQKHTKWSFRLWLTEKLHVMAEWIAA